MDKIGTVSYLTGHMKKKNLIFSLSYRKTFKLTAIDEKMADDDSTVCTQTISVSHAFNCNSL